MTRIPEVPYTTNNLSTLVSIFNGSHTVNRIVVAAYVTLVGSSGWILVGLYLLYMERKDITGEAVLALLGLFVTAASSLYLVLGLKLHGYSQAYIISEQNRILTLKIEQAELQKKLTPG